MLDKNPEIIFNDIQKEFKKNVAAWSTKKAHTLTTPPCGTTRDKRDA
jgi:hypothetical protein